ncbi:hypothetical protein [Dickeya dianthicola]|uniref:hypothetical protein n=1 Tax=Dickeya dianthicola TaxID=204039 RepID=UPI0030194295
MTGNYLFYRSVSEFFEPPVNPVLSVLNPQSLNHLVNPVLLAGRGSLSVNISPLQKYNLLILHH